MDATAAAAFFLPSPPSNDNNTTNNKSKRRPCPNPSSPPPPPPPPHRRHLPTTTTTSQPPHPYNYADAVPTISPPPPPHSLYHHQQHQQQQDIIILVGDRRRPYTVSAQTLATGSEYFRKLLLPSSSPPRLLTVDCEESIFESLLILLRYGTYSALPQNLPHSHLFKLRREVQFYGISVSDSITDRLHGHHASFAHSSPVKSRDHDSSSTSISSTLSISLSSSPSSSPKSSWVGGGKNFHPSDLQRRCDLAVELPELAIELAEPARLVLVSCTDPGRAAFFSCKHCSRQHDGNAEITSPDSRSSIRSFAAANSAATTQWALNFHYRHVFCTNCGCPPREMAPRHFSELFMAAAAYFSDHDDASPSSPSWKWRVTADSTCTFKFLQHPALPCSSCAQTGARANGYRDDPHCAAYVNRSCTSNGEVSKETPVWAANCFYSHAFCTRCGHCAEGPVLVSLLLTLRYGGGRRKTTFGSTSSSRSST